MILSSERLFLCIVLAATATQIMADVEAEILAMSSTASHKYCGSNLVNVLTDVCDGMYNRPKNGQKKFVPSDNDLSKYRSKRSVDSVYQKHGIHGIRIRRGAYDECCRKGCTFAELVGYCGGF